MSIQNWPRWKKTLGIISLIVIVLDVVALLIVWLPCITSQCDGLGEGLITVIFLLPILGIIVGGWIIGWIIGKIKSKNLVTE